MKEFGKIYLIPTTLGDNEPLEVLPLSIKKIIEDLQYFIVENEKSARRFIKRITPKKSQASLELLLLDKYTKDYESSAYLDVCLKGISVGILSEAGVPAIADPGASIVKQAHQLKIRVVPLVGPSSILMAMMASGLNGQNFAFNGYLPIDKLERKIMELEELLETHHQELIEVSNSGDSSALMELSKLVSKEEAEVEELFEQFEEAQMELDEINESYKEKIEELS